MLTGPTTLLATLTSLQMGFRTLALEKSSSEVWDTLGAVKNEFGKFGAALAHTRKNATRRLAPSTRPRCERAPGAEPARRRGAARSRAQGMLPGLLEDDSRSDA